ncbi:hypothetical protein K435DRAFT_309553 [Dendrothele bispora CBS 962.96]|uniref:Uncharacterized protein n=1 Tax=Dendrothele bispora (strain CBS 962.96) TaxID=1314807 RepID=A0A4S8MJP5_DENBC|nr:hypothetical protein K435DRAFT_309553 [Dendrothele bispora CBS 962.96]
MLISFSFHDSSTKSNALDPTDALAIAAAQIALWFKRPNFVYLSRSKPRRALANNRIKTKESISKQQNQNRGEHQQTTESKPRRASANNRIKTEESISERQTPSMYLA